MIIHFAELYKNYKIIILPARMGQTNTSIILIFTEYLNDRRANCLRFKAEYITKKVIEQFLFTSCHV